MLRKVAVVGLVVMAMSAAARADLPETPRLRQLTVGDGLPSDNIHALALDRGGYLWIGTSDGLARYDGVEFRVWRKEDGLPGSEITSLLVDAADRLWIGTTDGLVAMAPDRGTLQGYSSTERPEVGSDIVWSLAATPDGATWFGTATGGLHRIGTDGSITRFAQDPDDPLSLPSSGVVDLKVAADGRLWIATRDGVARWTGEGFERARGLPDLPVMLGLTVDPEGNVWVGMQNGVYRGGEDGTFARWSPGDGDDDLDPVHAVLLRDSNGLYWLHTRRALVVADGGDVSMVRTYSGLKQGPVVPDWTHAVEDHEGGLWFASHDSGLWYLPANWRQFAVLVHDRNEPGSLGNADVTAIAPAADGLMWLVGNGGVLDLLDPDTGAVEHVYRDAEDYVPSQVLEDDAGAVWIGFQSGLGRYDRAAGSMRLWYADDDEGPAQAGENTALVQAAGGLVWAVSDHGGVQARDRQGAVRERILPGGGRGLAEGVYLSSAVRAPDGGLWLAASHGLLMWNAGTRTFDPVPGSPGGYVAAIAMQGGGRVWLSGIGTLEAYRWDGAALTLEARLDAADGVPQIVLGGLTVDAAGIVWVSSARGLLRVDPERRSVNLFGVSHGLPAQDIRTPPVPRPFDGRIHTATTAGLVIFDPATVRPDERTPELAIEAAEVRGRDGVRRLDPMRSFRLSHTDYELRILARLRGFNAARHNQYRFRLHGYDEGWIETGAGGERVFPALAPGGYRLEVIARTPLSSWSEPMEMVFDVAAPWWRTWWARSVAVVALALFGWWLLYELRRRLRQRLAWQRVQHERELARQASEAKTRFLATLGHEVRTPMTGVLGMSELLLQTPLQARQRSYAESIRRAGEHLMRLVNDALDLARIEAGKLQLDPQPFDPRRLVDEVGALMAPLARQRGLGYRAQVAPGVPAGLHGDVVRIRQILLNLLGNAIKFTERGHVQLELRPAQPDGLRLAVSDTGPGLDAEQRQRLFRRFEQAEGARTASRYGGSGLGLAICQELAAEMGGRIEVESLPERGTRFVVELPLPPAEIVDATVHAQPLPDAGAGRQVLLVEDDPTVAEVIVGLLATHGYAPTHVGHGLAALAVLAERDFDVALLDLDLPGIDGIALARQMRVQGHRRPLIAITARADSAAEPLARDAGFDGFLRKPLTGASLAAAIAAVLDRRGDRAQAEG